MQKYFLQNIVLNFKINYTCLVFRIVEDDTNRVTAPRW